MVEVTYNPEKVIREDRIKYYAKKVYKDLIKQFCTNEIFDEFLLFNSSKKELCDILTEYIVSDTEYNNLNIIIDNMYVSISRKLNKRICINPDKYPFSRFPEIHKNTPSGNHEFCDYKDASFFGDLLPDIISCKNKGVFGIDGEFDDIQEQLWIDIDNYTTDLLLEEDDDTVDTKPAKLIPYNT